MGSLSPPQFVIVTEPSPCTLEAKCKRYITNNLEQTIILTIHVLTLALLSYVHIHCVWSGG